MGTKRTKKMRANNALSTDKSIVGRFGGDIRESSEKLKAITEEFEAKLAKIMEQRLEQEQKQGKKLSLKEFKKQYAPILENEFTKFHKLYSITYYEELYEKYGEDLFHTFAFWFCSFWFVYISKNLPDEPLKLLITEENDILCGRILGINSFNIYGEMFIKGDKRWEIIPSEKCITKDSYCFHTLDINSYVNELALKFKHHKFKPHKFKLYRDIGLENKSR